MTTTSFLHPFKQAIVSLLLLRCGYQSVSPEKLSVEGARQRVDKQIDRVLELVSLRNTAKSLCWLLISAVGGGEVVIILNSRLVELLETMEVDNLSVENFL